MIGPETFTVPPEVLARPAHVVLRGVCRGCGCPGARLYPCGWRCVACTPAASGGRPEPPTTPHRPHLSLVKEPTHV